MQELEADLGIQKTTVSEILTQDLGMKRVMEKIVLWLLLLKQKVHCAAGINDLIQTASTEPDFLKTVPTLKETEATLSCAQCFLHLVSSPINVSIFQIMCLDTFQTDLICLLSGICLHLGFCLFVCYHQFFNDLFIPYFRDTFPTKILPVSSITFHFPFEVHDA